MRIGIGVYKMKLDEDNLPHLVQEGNLRYGANVDRRCRYDDQERIFDLAKDLDILSDAEESTWLLCMDFHFKPLGVFKVASGSSFQCCANIKGIFQRALMTGASRMVIWHNHPSGYNDPSDADFETTKTIIKAGELLDISLEEHMVISRTGYYSMRNNNPELWGEHLE